MEEEVFEILAEDSETYSVEEDFEVVQNHDNESN